MKLYPFLFESNLHSIIWGGNKIAKWKGLPDEGKPIGESWEVSAVPSSDILGSNSKELRLGKVKYNLSLMR